MLMLMPSLSLLLKFRGIKKKMGGFLFGNTRADWESRLIRGYHPGYLVYLFFG